MFNLSARAISASLFALLVLVACTAAPQLPPAIHVVPEGFEGRVLVIFNRSDGLPAEQEAGAPRFRIPENGVLVTAFAGGKVGETKVYVERNGSRREIPFFLRLADIGGQGDPNETIAFALSHGSAPRPGRGPHESNVFWQFFVGPRGRALAIVEEHDFAGNGPGTY